MTIKHQLELTTQAVIDAHDAHLSTEVRWERRGLLGRLTRTEGHAPVVFASAWRRPLDRAA